MFPQNCNDLPQFIISNEMELNDCNTLEECTIKFQNAFTCKMRDFFQFIKILKKFTHKICHRHVRSHNCNSRRSHTKFNY